MSYMNAKKIFDNFEIYIGAGLQTIMILALFVQVIGRYVFNRSFAHIEEIAILCLILSVYFGACGATRKRQHLKITFLLERVGKKTRHVMEIFGNICFIAFNCIMVKAFIPIVTNLYTSGTAYVATKTPKWIMYGIIPLALMIMSLRLVNDIILHIKEFRMVDKVPLEQNNDEGKLEQSNDEGKEE